MNTHADELRFREIPETNTNSEEEMDKNGLEEDQEEPTLYKNSEMFSRKNPITSNVIGEILKNTINEQQLQIDPSQKWFMNTKSGL